MLHAYFQHIYLCKAWICSLINKCLFVGINLLNLKSLNILI